MKWAKDDQAVSSSCFQTLEETGLLCSAVGWWWLKLRRLDNDSLPSSSSFFFLFPLGAKIPSREEVITRSSASEAEFQTEEKKKGWLGEGFHGFGYSKTVF